MLSVHHHQYQSQAASPWFCFRYWEICPFNCRILNVLLSGLRIWKLQDKLILHQLRWEGRDKESVECVNEEPIKYLFLHGFYTFSLFAHRGVASHQHENKKKMGVIGLFVHTSSNLSWIGVPHFLSANQTIKLVHKIKVKVTLAELVL